ncbi:virulence protein (VirJ) [Faunimonas pinastri]|uniref:Virulence protein (VirJ) n=1 Tax=Faunimonas pinastri TaxID=1855383 RepID=A0A1H8ZYT7_9HYPH|nr:AcvB/VirJ family lysyl-phosphatidylglycerol hydrolase [Faunimonas pinastri]SEP69600.1 virulence protein (VirJ) [Faunimonas pinastri]
MSKFGTLFAAAAFAVAGWAGACLPVAPAHAADTATDQSDVEPASTVDVPAVGPDAAHPKALAVIYSGDGGWADLDKTIGDWMSHQGIHVVGVDAMETFWTSREPPTVADDLKSIVATADPTGKLPIMIIGYSYGADVFPFAWNLVDPAIKDRVKLIALLAPEHKVGFHVSIEGWIGIEDGDHDVLPAVQTLPLDRVLCVYGEEDSDDTICTEPSVTSKMEVIKTTGGHHFDENYEALGAHILDAFQRRENTPTTPAPAQNPPAVNAAPAPGPTSADSQAEAGSSAAPKP